MSFFRPLLVMMAMLFLASCTIESSKLLTELGRPGDPIIGLPDDRPFTITTFAAGTETQKAFATLTPEKIDPAFVRYTVSFNDGTPNRLVIQARYMSDDNYLLRYHQVINGVTPDLSQSGLAFLTRKGDDWYLMNAVSDDGALDAIFGKDAAPPGSGGSTLVLHTIAEAKKVSDWFAIHAAEVARTREFTRFRLEQ